VPDFAFGKITDHTVILPPNRHDIGLTARPTSTGFVAAELGVAADPIAMTDVIVAAEQAALGGADNWRWRKEYLRDFDAQAGMPVFEEEWLALQRPSLCNPFFRMGPSDDRKQLETRERGGVSVWVAPDTRPPGLSPGVVSADRQFGIGMDVGAGVSNSNSTIEVFTVDTREQAAEFAASDITPGDLGRLAVLVARYYNNALICCVGKMHGVAAIRAMVDDCGYTYLWRHHHERRTTEIATKDYGWMRGEGSDELLTGRWMDALKDGNCTLHSSMAFQEHEQYMYDELGRITWAPLANAPKEVRARHGDRVIACMLAHRACLDMPLFLKPTMPAPLSLRTFEGRRLAQKARETNRTDGW